MRVMAKPMPTELTTPINLEGNRKMSVEAHRNLFCTAYDDCLNEAVKRGWPLRLPLEGRPVRDILHVDDFSGACRAFIDSSMTRGLYNLGGGRENASSLREMIDQVAEIIQCNPVIDENVSLPAPVPLNYISDLTRVREELGWQPQIGIEEGLKSLI